MKNISIQVTKLLLAVLLLVSFNACKHHSALGLSTKETQSIQLQAKDIIIDHVNIVDSANGLRSDMMVVVRGNQIKQVVPSTKYNPASDVQVVDGSGKYLIPGLWDFHVHITFTPELENSMFNLFLANGVTSVRDTGGKLKPLLSWRERARNSLAPDIYIAGPLIDGVPSVYNGSSKGFPDISETVATPQDVENTVDYLAEQGVDFLKAYEMLNPEAFTALLQRAKKYNLPVTGHVPLSMSTVEASAKGLRSIEHTRNLEMDCSAESELLLKQRRQMLKRSQDMLGYKLRGQIHAAQHFRSIDNIDSERCADVLQQLAKNDTWQIPTLTLMAASRTGFYADDTWRSTFDYLPEPIRTKWRETTSRYQKFLKQPSAAREKRAQVSDWKNSVIKPLLDAGVRIVAGTDAPIFFLTPGFSLHKELETLVNAGMSTMQALDAATLAPAEYFNLQNTHGLVQENYLADLVLLNANPLENIRNTQEIEIVIKDGVLLDRTSLDNLLKDTTSLSK